MMQRNISPEARQRMVEGSRRGVATRQREREEGLQFAREWREKHRNTVWGIPPQPVDRCPECGKARG